MAGDLTFPDGLPVTLQFVGSNIEPNTTTALTLVNGGAGLVVPTGYKFHSMLVFAESNAAVSADTGTVVVRANTTTLGNGPTVALTNTAQSGSDTERVGAEGITARVIDCYSVKPIDAQTVRRALGDTGAIVVVEDHRVEGGLGDAVLDALAYLFHRLFHARSVLWRVHRVHHADVDLDATCNGQIVSQAGGPALCVVHYGTINVTPSGTLLVISSANQQGPGGGRAAVLDARCDPGLKAGLASAWRPRTSCRPLRPGPRGPDPGQPNEAGQCEDYNKLHIAIFFRSRPWISLPRNSARLQPFPSAQPRRVQGVPWHPLPRTW